MFDERDLRFWYNRGSCKTIKMTYNAALKKRVVRHDLIEEIGLKRDNYWGFFELTDEQFKKIVHKGNVSNILKVQNLRSKTIDKIYYL